MRLLLPLLAAGFILSGCGTTIPVREDEPDNTDKIFNYSQVNSRVGGIDVTIKALGGVLYSASAVRVGHDSTTFLDAATKLPSAIATRDLVSLSYQDHSLGAVTGGLAGLGVGLGGWIVAAISGDTNHGDSSGGGTLAIVLMPLAGGLGAGIGGAAGSTQEFVFRADTVHTKSHAPAATR